MSHINLFVGVDSREKEAFKVCRYSALRHASAPLTIWPLEHRELRQLGLFTRPWITYANGQYGDILDGKPFSTEFSHSRFLVPAYAAWLLGEKRGITPSDWVLFCDCDFLFMGDLAEIEALLDPQYAVMCVKHCYVPPDTMKMDGMEQTMYRHKNWSSFMAFNMQHKANDKLDRFVVNSAAGGWLHSFGWLDDSEIGALPSEWNHLVGVTESKTPPKAVHYTSGGPWFEGYENCPFAREWVEEYQRSFHPLPTVHKKLLEQPKYRDNLERIPR